MLQASLDLDLLNDLLLLNPAVEHHSVLLDHLHCEDSLLLVSVHSAHLVDAGLGAVTNLGLHIILPEVFRTDGPLIERAHPFFIDLLYELLFLKFIFALYRVI